MLRDREIRQNLYENKSVFVDTSPIEKRILTLLNRLSSSTRIERLCSGFIPCPIPEWWEDELVRKEFEKSFFESLVESTSSERRNLAPASILDTIGPHESTEESIRTALCRSLADPDWYETDFLGSST